MPAWATVLITLGGAVIGAGAAIGGTWLQMRHARTERRANERRELRERGAAVIGPLFRLLTQSRPEVLLSFGDEAPKRMNDLEYRWGELGDALFVYALGHPSRDVVQMADELASAVSLSLIFTRQAIDSHSKEARGGEGDEAAYEAANRSHREAVAISRKLATALREDMTEPEQAEQLST
jgi:hypothetical protein